ncbi:hypothetical protein EAE96_003957 [Botrytis aclada]|nr:hypothetical protein EAE96_003957 [Botrytis aclada]
MRLELSAESRRGRENYRLEGEEVPTDPMTRTRLSDSSVRYQRRPSHPTKSSSYSMQRQTRWEYSDAEDEDNQPWVMMKDSAQWQREKNDSELAPLQNSPQRRAYEEEIEREPESRGHLFKRRRYIRPSEYLPELLRLNGEDVKGEERSERYNTGQSFHAQNSGIKDPALVGGTDEVRRRRLEQLELTITKKTTGSNDENNNLRSEKDARTGWHKHTLHAD